MEDVDIDLLCKARFKKTLAEIEQAEIPEGSLGVKEETQKKHKEMVKYRLSGLSKGQSAFQSGVSSTISDNAYNDRFSKYPALFLYFMKIFVKNKREEVVSEHTSTDTDLFENNIQEFSKSCMSNTLIDYTPYIKELENLYKKSKFEGSVSDRLKILKEIENTVYKSNSVVRDLSILKEKIRREKKNHNIGGSSLVEIVLENE